MDLKVTARLPIAGLTLCLFLLLLDLVDPLSAPAQLDANGPNAQERSSVFTPPLDDGIEEALGKFRWEKLESLSARELERMQFAGCENYGLEEQLLSLDLFRSLAFYYRNLPYTAQSIDDRVLTESAPASRVAANTALLSALEFYAHSPLSRADVEGGLGRLTHILDVNAVSAPVQPEVRFWRAEGYRALGEYAPAEREYREAVAKSSDPRLSALTYFRLAELFEREERYTEADSSFADASRGNGQPRTWDSPLTLLAMLRRAAVLRSEKNYNGVLAELDRVESVYHRTEHTVRTSARDFEYSSPLVEELMLQTTEHDRLLSTAPNNGPPETSDRTSSQLVSPFFESEIDLLRGSALSELGQYGPATEVLNAGEQLIDGAKDSTENPALAEQARFYYNALKFERGWSLFQRGKYQDAAAAFLQLASEDTARRHVLTHEAVTPLREQGLFFDPFLNDSIAIAPPIIVDRSVLARNTLDTTFFFYNDFPERARYYAGVALARAGLRDEAASVLLQLTLEKGRLYSDRAIYQLALIRFTQHSYEAQKLLEPIAYEPTVQGAYASFLLGELAYRKNLYERAEEYFLNSYAHLPPEDTAIRATAHLERGLSLVPLGNWREAADELNTYLSLTHESIPGTTDEALFWLGKSYFRFGEYDSASTVLDRLLTTFPESRRLEDAQYTYAWSLFEHNDFARAEPAFERVIALDSISRYAYDALARAGDSYYALNDFSKASKLYNQAVDRPAFNDLRTTRALDMLGLTRMRLDSARSAMNEFNYLVTKYPSSDIVDEADFNLALAAYSINQVDRAEQAVETIVSKYHQSSVASRALYVAAFERVHRNDARGAISFYEQVLKDYPRSQEAGPSLVALQDALVALKRVPEAIAVADTFVARNPANPLNPGILLHSGELRLRLGQAASALATFQQFLAIYPAHPSRPSAELSLARAELATGDTSSALAQLANVIAQYDSLDVASAAYLERARIERKRNAPDSAASNFEAAYQMRYYSSDAAPQAMLEYAQMLTDRTMTDSAIAVLNDLSTRYPIEASISARAAIHAGELLTGKRQYEQARATLQRIIAAHPKDLLGGAAEVRIGETYRDEENWSQAAEAFANARRNFTLAPESEARALIGLAEASAKTGKKADAVRDLRQVLQIRGLGEGQRTSADSLLHQLAPPLKTKPSKAKKGGAK